MSSNDMLMILKKKGNFEIHHDLCVDNNFTPRKSSLVRIEKTLIEAIKFANEYCEEEIVEYGYHIQDSCLKEVKNEKIHYRDV